MSVHSCIDCGRTVTGPDWMTRCKRCYALHMKGKGHQYKPGGVDRPQAGSIPPPGTRPIFLDEVVIRKMLSLVHPDKHDNSKTANEITQLLLEQRRER